MTADTAQLESLLGNLGLKTPIPQFLGANSLCNPLDIGRSYFADILSTLVDCDAATAYNSIQWPNNIFSADLVAILPKLKPGVNQKELAFEVMQKFPNHPLFVLPLQEGVQLLVIFKPETLVRLFIPLIRDRKSLYGRFDSGALHEATASSRANKKLLIEFSSPNIAGEFHGKHLRSTILGGFISNIYENMGWDVTKINYLGDWGKPIGLLGVGWEKYGSEQRLHEDPVRHVLEIYHKISEEFLPEQAASKKVRDEGGDPAELESQGLFAARNAYFKKLEEGDTTTTDWWKLIRETSIKNYTEFYARLNLKFDEYSGESQVNPDTMAEVEKMLKEKGVCEESNGSLIVDLKKHGARAGVAIIRDRAGSSTYLLRDLAAIVDRHRKYAFDKMIYVVANDHSIHFSRLFKILELAGMPDIAQKLQHVSFNEVSHMLPDLEPHRRMLGVVLDQCHKAIQASFETNPTQSSLFEDRDDTVSSISTAAILHQELSCRRTSEHSFSVERMTAFEKSTGLDVLFWYKKLCERLQGGKIQGTDSREIEPSNDELALIEEEDETNLLRLLIQYPEVTQAAYKSLEPASITTYLSSIIEQLQCCLAQNDAEINRAQINLYEATKIVLENGMKLFGINCNGM